MSALEDAKQALIDWEGSIDAEVELALRALIEEHEESLIYWQAETDDLARKLKESRFVTRQQALHEAANDVRLVMNGGGHAKSAVWFLTDKAEQEKMEYDSHTDGTV